MKRNKLRHIVVSEISLVKRGAVPSALVHLHKSAEPAGRTRCKCGSTVLAGKRCEECAKDQPNPIPDEYMRRARVRRRRREAILGKAMEVYAEGERQSGESSFQAVVRLCNQGDPTVNAIYTAYESVGKKTPTPTYTEVPEAVLAEARARRRTFPNLTLAQAITRVLSENPHLYGQVPE